MFEKYQKFCCIALIFLFSICALGQDFEYGIAPFAIITRQSNVREKPSKKSAKLESLKPNSEIRVIIAKPKNGYLYVLYGDGEQGYVYYKNVATPKDFAKNKNLNLLAEPQWLCPYTFADCPLSGCAKPNDTGKALFNRVKRGKDIDDMVPLSIDFNDLENMQTEMGKRLKLGSVNYEVNRVGLKNLRVKNGVVSESSLVRIVGYIPMTKTNDGLKAGSRSESVNCKSIKDFEKDIHIPLARKSNSTLFEGIVIEMIPQGRSQNWNLKNLRKIQREGKKVMVVGGLFYDNEHLIYNKPEPVLHGHSKRFTIWEIHPVTKFFICNRPDNSCNETSMNGWVALEKFQ